MTDLVPLHGVSLAPIAIHPVACDGCGAVGFMTDGKLPDGWAAEQLPSCEWPYGEYRECPRCVRESATGGDREH